MRRAGLRLRIAKLERQSLARRFPKVCSGVYDSEEDLIGIGDGSSIYLARQPGESLEQLTARAFQTWGAVLNLAAQYSEFAISGLTEADLPVFATHAAKPFQTPSVGIPGKSSEPDF